MPRLSVTTSLTLLVLAAVVRPADGQSGRTEPGPCERAWLLEADPDAVAEASVVRAVCGPERNDDERVHLGGGRWTRSVSGGERALSLDAFLLDPFEVTVANYRVCLGEGGCSPDRVADYGARSDCNLGAPGRERHPLNCVTWAGAKAFCEWRGGRLPSEAELDWASDPEGGLYPWGWVTPTCDLATFQSEGRTGCGYGSTRPVGQNPEGVSPQGVHDLAGNVAEWAVDGWVEALPPGAFHNPVEVGDPDLRPVRGGSWRDTIIHLGSHSRLGLPAGLQDPGVGLRCAYEVGSPRPPRALADGDGAPSVLASARVPAGPFLRGSPPGVGDGDEQPQRLLTLGAYRLGRLEVTVFQYRACVLAGGCRSFDFDGYGDTVACNYGRHGYGQHPMNCVSWFAAQEFCHWVGGRLPTEAEWEKAARGIDERHFPWGNQTAECGYANVNPGGRLETTGCGTGGTLPVGTFYDGVSPYDVFDLAGNVQEWVLDWYDASYYTLARDLDPTGPLTGSMRVVRGGSYRDDVPYVRSAFRFFLEPNTRNGSVGFRCSWPE